MSLSCARKILSLNLASPIFSQVEDFEELKRAAMEEFGQSQRTFKYPLTGEGDDKVADSLPP